ncbi:PAS/PAC sensor hybrid histidine kinase [Rhizobium sp. CF080]|uniref:PAS domain-containing hybrid sensor histidine kinase/response regulator n=1 Tax=Rhizobium sp. (strain CF080) TaxID=1144310 RepID=UPI000271A3C5|nr:response regulator [Rhizobium sp. CF080]EUB96764.1 PAS/PAC sensor hybrid histidine kinase [Rhizobium sp. CF080]
MDTESELLKTACERINDLAEPAFIKDSALIYVAVNAAYARLFGMHPTDFAGNTSRGLAGALDDADRNEKECRAIVFGTDETALCFDRSGVVRHEIHIERFLTEDDHTYLFGTFAAVPGIGAVSEPKDAAPIAGVPRVVPPPAGAQSNSAKPVAPFSPFNNALLDDALDMLEMGIGIYDKHNVLLYCNSQLINHFASISIDVQPGITLNDILGFAYDRRQRVSPASFGPEAPKKDAWIAERMKPFELPYSESIDQLSDGRWLRSINKRLENGLLIAIRHDVTEFKEQEMLLRAHVSETDLFRAVLEDLPVPVFVRNSDRQLTYANAAYEAMLGKPRTHFLGKTETEMFPDAADRFRIENDRVMKGEDIEKSEDITFPDGSVVPVITHLRRVTTGDGAQNLVGSRMDVSRIKEAQNKAEKIGKDLQTILHTMPVGVAILDEQFLFEYANPAFYAFWDAGERFDLPGRSYRDFLKVNFDNGVYSGSTRSFEEIYQDRIAALTDGQERPPIEVKSRNGLVIVISGTRLSGGKLLLSYMDITAVRKREQEIQEARAALETHGALMRDATSAMSQGLLILHDGEIIFSNDALPAMLDMPVEMVGAGGLWRDLFRYCIERGDLGTPEEAAAVLKVWEDNVEAGKPVFAAFRIEGRKWIHVEAKLTGSDHWLAVFTDVTEMKQREEDLTRLLQRAEAADRAKSEFLANMSHEIRTPMNGVLGMAELLAKSNLDTRQKTFIDIIVKSGNALLTIINDILDFSKIDAGQMKLRKAPFDPVEAIEDVATLLSSSAAEKDIELIVRGDASIRETVMGDAGRFRQIVTNLVGNAVKFTEKGHVFIDLRSEAKGPGEMILSIRIEDTGLGIPDEKLKSVFDKFSQVDTSSTRRHEGTGLGLAITAGLTELFGGYIDVTSEVGRGSVFTVHLPFQVVSERNVLTALPINTSGARILVVDDNPVNRRILTEQLTMWGFDTVAADSGAEGLAILSEAARIGVFVDAIVLDYHMPEMNGLDFAKHLRRDARFDGTGVVFLTSMDMAGDDSMFASLNIQAHLMKPARANLLRSTIIDVVRSIRTKRRAVEAEQAATRPQPRPVVQAVAPVALAAQPRSTPVITEEPAAPVSTPPMQAAPTLDVLVAEDNEVNQIVFTQILQTTGWLFQIVKNGAEAVEAWKQHDPAVIIMDVSMPVMNGHQATQKIRELEQETGTHTPIIGVTAHALESDRELCFQVGMDDYLSKPISPEALEAKVRNWLGGAIVSSVSN